MTLTGLAADASSIGGSNPRSARRLGAVAAMIVGAALGAAMILHLRQPLVWPLVVAAVGEITATSLWARQPSAAQPRAGVVRAERALHGAVSGAH
jgi:hypothetical protein